jgi:hypothetical protein
MQLLCEATHAASPNPGSRMSPDSPMCTASCLWCSVVTCPALIRLLKKRQVGDHALPQRGFGLSTPEGAEGGGATSGNTCYRPLHPLHGFRLDPRPSSPHEFRCKHAGAAATAGCVCVGLGSWLRSVPFCRFCIMLPRGVPGLLPCDLFSGSSLLSLPD